MSIKVNEMPNEILVDFYGKTVIFIPRKGEFISGIGKVEICGEIVRDGYYPIKPYIATKDGIEYDKFCYRGYKIEGTEVHIRMDAVGKQDLTSDIHTTSMDFPMLCTEHYLSPELEFLDFLELILSPHKFEIEGETYIGFGYQYRFVSRERKIHNIAVFGTWELGGHAEGNTVISLGNYGYGPIEFTARKGLSFSNAGYVDDKRGKFCDFQLGGRYWHVQHFDFQYNDKQCLVQYFEKPGYITGLLQKDADKDVFMHIDRFFFQFGTSGETIRKFVLFNGGKKTVSANHQRDRWSWCHDIFGEIARSHYGLKETPILPMISQDACLTDYRGTYLNYYLMADHYIDRISDIGLKVVFLGCGWKSDMDFISEITFSDPAAPAHVWYLEIPTQVGGKAGLKYFCDQAHKRGIKVILWTPPYLSGLSPLLVKGKKSDLGLFEWTVKHRDFTGLGQKDDLRVIAVDFNNPEVYDYYFNSLKTLREECGLDGVFIDSFSNLGFDPINWYRPDLMPQMDVFARLLADFQKIGLEIIVLEGVTPMGVTCVGNWIGGLDYYREAEFAMYKRYIAINPPEHELFQKWTSPDGYYRLVANQCLVRRDRIAYVEKNGELNEFNDNALNILEAHKDDILQIHHDYNAVLQYLYRRHILEDDCGMEWRNIDGKKLVLFTFKNFIYSSEHIKEVYNVTTGKAETLSNGSFDAIYRNTYLITLSSAKSYALVS